jgi:hypothetical protein
MMNRLECAVWNSGGGGSGLKILADPEVQLAHFDPARGTITLVLDSVEAEVNIAKKSFWTGVSGELNKRELGAYIERHQLRRGERVWLRVVEPGTVFAVERE